ncbi:hypothetical protein PR048_011917 [Dryococelus australis]|uniref:Reverse transcriptase RNase H-like domain-containing protein n=1 Tax=Dryococelus australis TaxID=614101 RepID=A0ABQ9HMV4_9NEOP|nr:hypothetical protein PR048_011917 [Dryococelus australis]
MGVAPSIVWEVLHEQQLYPYHLQRVHYFRRADFAPRVNFCTWFLHHCRRALETEASENTVAATLSQSSLPVALFSQLLSDTKRHHSSVEKEAQAIIESVRNWRHFILGSNYKLITDQRSASFVFITKHSGKIKNEEFMCWHLEMACFHYDIIYRPGKDNHAADALSRICAAIHNTEYTVQPSGKWPRRNICWHNVEDHRICSEFAYRVSCWEEVLYDALHAVRSLLCTAINCTPHEQMFKHPRRFGNGQSASTWLVQPGSVFLWLHNRSSKYDPIVEEVTLVEGNANYAHIKFHDGCEVTVSTRDVAPESYANKEIPPQLEQEALSVLTTEPAHDAKTASEEVILQAEQKTLHVLADQKYEENFDNRTQRTKYSSGYTWNEERDMASEEAVEKNARLRYKCFWVRMQPKAQTPLCFRRNDSAKLEMSTSRMFDSHYSKSYLASLALLDVTIRARNARAGGTGDPRENPSTSGIISAISTCENPGETRPANESAIRRAPTYRRSTSPHGSINTATTLPQLIVTPSFVPWGNAFTLLLAVPPQGRKPCIPTFIALAIFFRIDIRLALYSGFTHCHIREPTRVTEVSMEQRRNETERETGGPIEKTPTSGIVQHDFHMRKSGSDPAGD